MHRTSLRAAGSGGTMSGGGVAVLRPPKPPCWRDFVSLDSARRLDHFSLPSLPSASSSFMLPEVRAVADVTGGGAGGDVADSYSAVVGGGGSGAGTGLAKAPRTASKRNRARIHRTRSEHLIDTEELPEGELTVSLADTRPHELKLHARPARVDDDDRLYAEENNRRCQSWLASIEAAEPLDDVDYVHIHSRREASEEVGLESVDVEVPEETFSWLGEEREGVGNRETEQARPRSPNNTNASSSHPECGDLEHVLAAAGFAPSAVFVDGNQGSSGKNSRVLSTYKQTSRVSGGGHEGGGGLHGGLRVTSSSLNVHRKLSARHPVTISEHSGLE